MNILILTKEDCSFCDLAKEVIDRASAEWPVSVSTLHFESEEGRKLAEQSGALFPPVIFIDGEFFCYGRLSERRLRRELSKRLARRP